MKWKISKEGEQWESHEFKGGNLSMSIHHHINHDPDEWLLSCYDAFGSVQTTLGKVDIETAKIYAVDRVRARLECMLGDLD